MPRRAHAWQPSVIDSGNKTAASAHGMGSGDLPVDAMSPDRIDRPFIVLTETKSSYLHIPVWARYSPHLTRVEAHANTLSP